MNYLTITFKSPTSAPIFDEFNIDPAPHDAVEVKLSSSKEDNLILSVKLLQTSIQDLQKAEDIAHRLQKQLTFFFERHVQPFTLDSTAIEHCTTEPPRNGVYTCAAFIVAPAATLSAKATSTPPKWTVEEVADLITALERNETEESRVKINMFCSAMQTTDVVAKYMILYLIGVSFFANESQGKFDAAVLKVIPDEPMALGHHKQETKFTRLRNQIGHNRKDVTFADTKQEMEQSIPGLIRIVKELITNGVP